MPETICRRPFRVYTHPDGRTQLMCQEYEGDCSHLAAGNRFDPSIDQKRYLCAEHLEQWDKEHPE